MGRVAAVCAALVLSACGASPEQQWRAGTDTGLRTDLNYIEALQARAAKLAPGADAMRRYHVAKARAWLEFALDEYQENDNGPIIGSTLAQAELLIGALEQDSKPIDPGTPIVRGSSKIRDDLWTKAERAKDHPNFSCAAHKVAQLEVGLVWAGHEYAEAGWRHASRYVQVAEDHSIHLAKLLEACKP